MHDNEWCSTRLKFKTAVFCVLQNISAKTCTNLYKMIQENCWIHLRLPLVCHCKKRFLWRDQPEQNIYSSPWPVSYHCLAVNPQLCTHTPFSSTSSLCFNHRRTEFHPQIKCDMQQVKVIKKIRGTFSTYSDIIKVDPFCSSLFSFVFQCGKKHL